MWFKVEINQDGTVKTCEQVDARSNGQGAIVYVEADSAESAVCKAVIWRREYLEMARKKSQAQRDRALEAGLCCVCKKRNPRPGKKQCYQCAQHGSEGQAAKYARMRAAGINPYKKDENGNKPRLPPEMRLTGGGARVHPEGYSLRTLQGVREAYKRDPKKFGSWINEQIRLSGGE